VEKGALNTRGPAARCGRRARVRVRIGGRGGGAEEGNGGGRRRARRNDRTEEVVEEGERRQRERAAASMAASPEARGDNLGARGFGNFQVAGLS